jgi:hypothetical protein
MNYERCPYCGCTQNMVEVIECHSCGTICCENCMGQGALICPQCKSNIGGDDSKGFIHPRK